MSYLYEDGNYEIRYRPHLLSSPLHREPSQVDPQNFVSLK